MSDSDSEVEWGIAFQRLVQQVDELKVRVRELEVLQKQDADEAVGAIGELKEAVEELEQDCEKLEDDLEHHKHLFERYRIADLFK